MTAAFREPEHIADRTQIAGMMRELFIWNSKIAAGTLGNLVIEDIDEPEDMAVEAPRGLRVTAPRDLPHSAALTARHPRGTVCWESSVAIATGPAFLPFPKAVKLLRDPEPPARGVEIVGLFCRTGAIAGAFLAAQRRHIRAFAAADAAAWGPSLMTSFVDHVADGSVKAYCALTRLSDQLWLFGDVAGMRVAGEPGSAAFIAQALLTSAQIAQVGGGADFLIGWAPRHPFWLAFDDFLADGGAAWVRGRFSTTYTRFDAEKAKGGVALRETRIHRSGQKGFDSAEVLLASLCPQEAGSSHLANMLRAKSASFDRVMVELLEDGKAAGLAVIPALPGSWNLRLTCNCVWLLPYRTWRDDERLRFHRALRDHPAATDAPGILELQIGATPPPGDKVLDWFVLAPQAFEFFRNRTL